MRIISIRKYISFSVSNYKRKHFEIHEILHFLKIIINCSKYIFYSFLSNNRVCTYKQTHLQTIFQINNVTRPGYNQHISTMFYLFKQFNCMAATTKQLQLQINKKIQQDTIE